MRVDYSYVARPEADRHLGPPTQAVHYSTGAFVGPGVYQCTLCGQTTTVAHARALATCSRCDNTEYSVLARAA